MGKMTFNIQKWEFIRITHKKRPIVYQYTLYNSVVQEVTYTTYLGLTINSTLSWSNHIRWITSKANSIKGFLQCNLHNCPISTKINCYKSPVLEYACVVWDPYLQKDILAVEAAQRCCARFVYNNYPSYASVTTSMQGCSQDKLSGGCRVMGNIVFTGNAKCKMQSILPPTGVWGHAPQGNFWKITILRLILLANLTNENLPRI